MSKYLVLLTFIGLSFVVACGPSAEEKQAEEMRYNDSVNAAEAALIAAEEAAILAAQADSAMLLDTTIVADTTAK
ncbi:MAG: hypothetical protein IPK10_11465 [Bacteroidetes bacterium]|nr:hypothetical protein [Bacteroidota bacterium]